MKLRIIKDANNEYWIQEQHFFCWWLVLCWAGYDLDYAKAQLESVKRLHRSAKAVEVYE